LFFPPPRGPQSAGVLPAYNPAGDGSAEGVDGGHLGEDTAGHRRVANKSAAAAGVVTALRTRVPAALTVRGALDRGHPAEPHWYLNKLGTAPGVRGQGLASALLTAQLRHCATAPTPQHRRICKPPSTR